jgi:hypothetical protein
VDLAVLRVLAQKESLGLLDETFDAEPEAVDLDSPAHREVALRLAEESVVLLANDGTLPLTGPARSRIAVIGPNADRSEALMGCYSFANHVLAHHPDVPLGFATPSVLESLRTELPEADVRFGVGAAVEGEDRSGFAAAVSAAAEAEVAVVVAGDQAGLFGRGTVGEGNDAESLDLPGVQRELVEAVVATGTPTVLVLLTGRPYAIEWALSGPSAPAAVLQAFFPGEEGGTAIARVLSGSTSPSGRLPVSLPRSAGAQPYSYLHPVLGGPSEVTSVDPTPPLAFGHGLAYTTFAHADLAVDGDVAAGDVLTATVRVRNTGDRAGTDVVQLYANDVVASVTRPVAQLLAYRRVALEPGEEVLVRFAVPTALLAFSDRRMVRVVEPGAVRLWVGPSVATEETVAEVTLTGATHEVGPEDGRVATVSVERAEASAR